MMFITPMPPTAAITAMPPSITVIVVDRARCGDDRLLRRSKSASSRGDPCRFMSGASASHRGGSDSLSAPSGRWS
jgi:hypothetical protein